MKLDIEQYTRTFPQYKDELAFLQHTLDFQARLAEKIEPNLAIDQRAANISWQAGIPLFANDTAMVSPALFFEGLNNLRHLLPDGSDAQDSLDQLLNFLTDVNVRTFLKELWTDNKACVHQLVSTIPGNPEMPTFLTQTVLSPFFWKQAQPYLPWLEQADWQRGYCPMCGSEPGMSRLTQESGQRILECSVCYTEWCISRLGCPFCEDKAQVETRYFTVDGDDTYRVVCCDQCHRYLKTVDERRAGRLVNLLAEDVVTPYLDELATEQGYHAGGI